MAEIQRTVIIGGDQQSAVNSDLDALFEAANGGLDPTTLPNGKLTADKLFISNPGTYSTAFRCGSGQIAAGGVGVFLVGIVGPTGAAGVSSGQYYLAPPYADFFIDPTGSAGGPASISNIYSGNSPWSGIGLILPSVSLRNSSSPGIPQLFQAMCAVHNFDSVAHYVYTTLNFALLNTQVSSTGA